MQTAVTLPLLDFNPPVHCLLATTQKVHAMASHAPPVSITYLFTDFQ